MKLTAIPQMQLRWQKVDSVNACFVSGESETGFDCDCAILLQPQLASAKHSFMAIYNHTNHWCRPVFGEDLTQLPEKRVSALLLRNGSRWQYFLPVCADTFKTAIRGCADGFAFYMYPNCEGLTECRDQLAFVCGEGDDPFLLMGSCAEAAAKLLGNGLKMRSQRQLPEVFEYLGWCSWDALQIRVNHQGLLDKAEEFKSKQVPVRFAIIDDMWADVPELNEIPEDISFPDMVKAMHASKLRSFRGDPKRFPQGMAAAIADLKKAGIPQVGIWFPVTGYWSGLTPDGQAKELMHCLAYTPQGRLLVAPEKSKTDAYFDFLCSQVRSWGADFVKVDNQGCHTQYRGVAPIGQTAGAMQTALDSAAQTHFGGALINCMGMPSECMFHRPDSPISRCSDDFLPENREWFSKHILQCAYNGLLQGQYYVNDWDMWWTDDSQAAKNSLCRAVSGGPIYVSDKIGRTNPEVLAPLVFRDGRILRCDESAIPAADCLTGDPTQAGKPFKLRNRAGKAGVLAVFNIDGENRPVSGCICADDVGLDGTCVCYEHFSGECRILTSGERVPVILENNDAFRLYTFVPVDESGITWLGRTDKYIGIKAMIGLDGETVQLYEGGSLAFVSDPPVRVFSQTRELPVTRRGILCTVDAHPEETDLRIQK